MQKNLLIACAVLMIVFLALVLGRSYFQTKSPEPIACTMDAKICPDGSAVGRVGPSCEFAPCPEIPEVPEDPIINMTSPKPDSVISAPLEITGKARGSWFYEGAFSIYLIDESERILAETRATSMSDWMTEDFVPFSATMYFSLPENSGVNRGFIVLLRDNPSGLPENEGMRKIPVQF